MFLLKISSPTNTVEESAEFGIGGPCSFLPGWCPHAYRANFLQGEGEGHAMGPYPERASPAKTGFLHSDYFFAEWAQNTAGRRIIMFDLHFLNIGWEVGAQRVERLSNWGEFFSRSSDNHWKRILNPVVRTGLIYERSLIPRRTSRK